MYNECLTGKNLSEAVAALKAAGITDIEIVENNTKGEYKNDGDLVVKADIDGNKAVLITSKFLLRI